MTLQPDNNGWGEYKRLVLHEIKQLRKEGIQREERLLTSFEKLEKSITVKTEINAKDIITLKVNAAKWGAASGVVATILIKLLV